MDLEQDLAEVLFRMGDLEEAKSLLEKLGKDIGDDYVIKPEKGSWPGEGLPREPLAIMGKVELTLGEMSFARGDLVEGVRHYIMAYAYFDHFSPDAVETDNMIEYVYNHLRKHPVKDQRQALEKVVKWVEEVGNEKGFGIDVKEFLGMLRMLLGV